MLALMSLLLIVDRQSAGFFELLLYFLSIPVAVYEVRHGVKMAVTLTIAFSIISFMFSTITGMFYAITSVIVGLVYGYGVIKDWKNSSLLFFTIIANVIITYITVVLFAGVFGYDIQEEVNVMMALFPNNETAGLDLAKFMLEIVILSYLAIAFMQSVVTHLGTNVLLQRLKLKHKRVHTIFDVKVPKIFAFVILGVYLIYFFTANMTLPDWVHQSVMALYLVSFIGAVSDGCITIMCFLRLNGKGKGTFILLMLACMIPLLNNFIAIVGIVDIYGGIREKLKEGVLNEISRKN